MQQEDKSRWKKEEKVNTPSQKAIYSSFSFYTLQGVKNGRSILCKM